MPGGLNSRLDIFPHMPGGPAHPPDDRHHDHRTGQQQYALETLLADLPFIERHGRRKTQRHSQPHARPHESDQVRTAGTAQGNQHNAGDQSGFEALSEGDQKGIDQVRRSIPVAMQLQLQKPV